MRNNMSILEAPNPTALPSIPDDLTIVQLLLDGVYTAGIRPIRPEGSPWLIDDETGRSFGLEEACYVIMLQRLTGSHRCCVDR